MNGVDEVLQGATDEQPSEEVLKFYKLIEDMNGKLYERSKHSRLYICDHFSSKIHVQDEWKKGSTTRLNFSKGFSH